MYAFMQLACKKFNLPEQNYAALHHWSVNNPADFWGTFWDYSGIVHSAPCRNVVDDPGKMPGAKWFEGTRLNFAENLLQHRGNKTAIIFRGEDGTEKRLSRDELYSEVAGIAAGLKNRE